MAIKIYIDQGHNPQNPNAGAEGNGLREQDIVFRIGVEPNASSQIGSSNSESLRLRVNEANAWGADYFISLHTNASSNSSATGVEAFAFSRPSRAFDLGVDILSSLSAATGLRNRGMQARTNLYVLRRTAMPAVLVELGFITNPSDAALMNGSPELFAEGIYRGILEYTGF